MLIYLELNKMTRVRTFHVINTKVVEYTSLQYSVMLILVSLSRRFQTDQSFNGLHNYTCTLHCLLVMFCEILSKFCKCSLPNFCERSSLFQEKNRMGICT